MTEKVKLHIYYTNRVEYMTCGSAWASNLIAWALMRDNQEIEKIFITDENTGEVLRVYKRG